MRTAVLSTGVALVLLSQPAARQALGKGPVSAAFGQANAALGQVNGTIGSLGINSGVGSVGTSVPVPTAVAVPAAPASAAAGGTAGGGTPTAPGLGSASRGPASAPSSPAAPASAAPVSFVSASAATLPVSLRPVQQGTERPTVYWSDIGFVTRSPTDLQALRVPLRDRSTSPSIVQRCRNAVAVSAVAYGAVGLDTAAAGPVRSTPAGYRVTIVARVLYSRPDGAQVRQATFNCQLNGAGQVVAMR